MLSLNDILYNNQICSLIYLRDITELMTKNRRDINNKNNFTIEPTTPDLIMNNTVINKQLCEVMMK